MMKLRIQLGSVFIPAMVLLSPWLSVNVFAQTAAFVALSGMTTNAAYSYDGIHWLACPYGIPFDYGCGNGFWAESEAVAYGGIFTAISGDSDTNAAYSYDGITWTASPTGLPTTQGCWQGVAETGGYFTAISFSDGLLAYSTDGENWTNLYGPMMTSPVYLMNDCWSIASGMCSGTLTIEVSSVADNVYSFNRSPPDGLWQYGSLPVLSEWVVAYGNNGFVAVGPNTNAYTTNGNIWHSAHSISGNWSSIAYGNGTFVALQSGSATAEYTINPASGWTSCSMPVSDNWSGIAWNSNLFVAIASGSTNAAYSPDGINWTLSSTGLPVSDSWACVAAGAPLALPVITNEPADIATLPAFSPTFSVGATSTYALGYQWLFDGTNIAGATNSSYTLVNVQSNDVGSYAVVVTNIYGSVTSSVATLTLNGYITNGLVAWWRMADQSGTTAADWSGNGLNLPIVGPSPTWGSNYITFDGTNYGNITNSAFDALDDHNLTVCAWVNLAKNGQQGIVNKFSENTNYAGWSFQVTADNRLDMYVEYGQDITNSGPTALPLGQWVFVTMVWHYQPSSNSADFYFNGVLDSSPINGGASESSSGGAPLQVGSVYGVVPFGGSMRDVAIYNRTLSVAEVETNYLNTVIARNVPYPDLLYYTMANAGETNVSPVTMTNYGLDGLSNGAMILIGPPKAPEWHGGLGSVSNGLHFNGMYSYLDTSNSAPFNFTTNSFTINLWFRPYGSGYYIMGNDAYKTNGWYLRLVEGTTKVQFGAETNSSDYSIQTLNGNESWPAGVVPVATNWVMLTVTRDGTNTPLILENGIIYETTGSFANPESSTNNLLLGYGQDSDPGGPNYLDGDIWLVQIWSQALPATAILTLHSNQMSGTNWP